MPLTIFKYLCLLLLLAGPAVHAQAQYDLEHIYNPSANAGADIEQLSQQATREGKHVLLQVGGNWCIWCKRLYKFMHDDAQLDSMVRSNYLVYHLNYSKENRNLPLLQKLGYPQRFGFPVLVILDAKGARLHTQDTGLLESADTYDKKKLLNMLRQWSPAALSPAHYITQ